MSKDDLIALLTGASEQGNVIDGDGSDLKGLLIISRATAIVGCLLCIDIDPE
jgi:hypothetical protein